MPGSTLWRRLLRRAEPARRKPPPGSRQQLVLNNDGPAPLEIMIEVSPERYVLPRGAEMVIDAKLEGAPFTVNPFSNGLQIYAGNDIDPIVSIDGVIVEPDWDTPTPESN
jgi:hypothetical protein